MDATAVSPESFDALHLFMQADWVVRLVMLGLAFASLWSWTIILDKLFRLGRLNREADRFEAAVASGRSLEDVAAEAGELIATADVEAACIDLNGRPRRPPPGLIDAVGPLLDPAP